MNSVAPTENKSNFDTLLSYPEKLLLKDILGLSLNDFLPPFSTILPHKKDEFNEKRALLLQGYPLDYLLKEVLITNYYFHIPAGVFIPREETELILPKLRQKIASWISKGCLSGSNISLLDLCCGTGFLGINLHNLSTNIILADLSPLALKTTEHNLKRNNILNAEVVESNIFSSLKIQEMAKNDTWILTCNPPYVPVADKENSVENNIKYEPELAIFSGEDGLDFFKKCLQQMGNLTNLPGFIFFELDVRNVETAQQLFSEKYKQYTTEIWQDCWKRNRFLVAYKL